MSEVPSHKNGRVDYSPEAITAGLKRDRRARHERFRPRRFLRLRPYLKWYKRRAKDLKAGNPQVGTLSEAQREVARCVGFASWRALDLEIKARNEAAARLKRAMERADVPAIAHVTRAHPMAVLDAGSVASPDEIALLVEAITPLELCPDWPGTLLDAAADRGRPQELESCLLAVLSSIYPDRFLWNHAAVEFSMDVIGSRRGRAASRPDGGDDVGCFDRAISVLSPYWDEPEPEHLCSD